MTYQELLELKHNRAEKLKAGNDLLAKKDFEAHKALMAEVAKMNAEIDAAEAQLAEEGRAWEAEGQQKLFSPGQEGEPDSYAEAVKSFAAAARAGFPRMKAAGEMMNEGTDADGGYTVPPDIVTKILSLRETKESLLGEVRIIPVNTPSGRRTIKKRSQHQGFSTVAEAAKFGRTATPQFTTLRYEIEKRGGYLPVTNELMADSDNNIAAVVQEWLADEARVTANREILEVIGAQTARDLKNLDGILAAWVGLGSAFRSTSKLITNDDGLLWLGTLKDDNGRYLLTPNPADPHQLRLCVGPHTLPVKTYDNDTIPTKEKKIPMILGDLKEGVAYWDRQQFSVRVSDTAVAGELNAFEQDLTLWRGSLRDDCTAWDDEAFINGFITAGGSEAAGTGEGGGNSGTAEGGGAGGSGGTGDSPEG